LHNLTPLAFISEIVPRHQRARAVLLPLIPFILVPAVVASGLPQRAIEAWFGYSALTAPSLFQAGRYPLVAFLPQQMRFEHALPLFEAAVTAQAMHYLSVIAVMPRLLARYRNEPARGLVPWPSWRNFYIAVAALALAVFAGHALDYPNARAFYSVGAAIHSWVELPIFLIALGFGFTATQSTQGR
jgi:hypothetical protein